VEGNKLERNRISPIVENTQIPLFEFEFLQSGPSILGNYATGYRFSISSIYKMNQLNWDYRI
jgi:hypothetical protein